MMMDSVRLEPRSAGLLVGASKHVSERDFIRGCLLNWLGRNHL